MAGTRSIHASFIGSGVEGLEARPRTEQAARLMKPAVSLAQTSLIGIVSPATALSIAGFLPHHCHETPAATGSDATPATRITLVSKTHRLRKSSVKLDRNRHHLDRVLESVNTTGVGLVLIAGDLTEDGDLLATSRRSPTRCPGSRQWSGSFLAAGILMADVRQGSPALPPT